jgi:hypothetical protein
VLRGCNRLQLHMLPELVEQGAELAVRLVEPPVKRRRFQPERLPGTCPKAVNGMLVARRNSGSPIIPCERSSMAIADLSYQLP